MRNSGTGPSGASTTRYYLSLDGLKNAGDILLTGTRAVPALAAGATSQGLVTVTIPSTTPLNTYTLLVCADDLAAVAESNEGNNCSVASSGTVTVTRPDLAEITVTMTPASPVRAPGTTFSVTDTTQNFGSASGPSTTRYYLSLDVTKNAGDTLLTGSRSVPALATFVTNSGTVTVTIPSTTPLNTYFLLACADDLNTVAESNESNNCNLAVSGTVTVTGPDLIEKTVTTTPAAPVRAPGTTFSVTDRTLNAGVVASGLSTTRYYLSLDGTKNAGDILLTGTRSVPGLAAGASHSATVTVTIPAATPLNNYVLLACADDLSTVAETNEGNNCLAASGSATVTVTRPNLLEDTVSPPPTTKARHQLHGDRHGAKCGGGGVGLVDNTLLSLAGRGKECGRHAAGRDPGGAGSGGGGDQFGDDHGDHPLGHTGQHLRAARLCRRPEYGGGDHRDQQLKASATGVTVTLDPMPATRPRFPERLDPDASPADVPSRGD